MSGVSASGLLYQHEQCDPKIIHRDVKAANILLDDDCEAVVGDFGLAKLLDHRDSHIATAVRGTVGHIAPEYLSTGQSSDKTDVFGFGILLLELISGQRALEFGDVHDIQHYAVTDHLPHGLLDCLLPGPVTLVLRRVIKPGIRELGVRVPDCNFIRVIARGSRSALALTTVNLSGQPSSIEIKGFENLWEHCASVYDGGILPAGRAGSTVVWILLSWEVQDFKTWEVVKIDLCRVLREKLGANLHGFIEDKVLPVPRDIACDSLGMNSELKDLMCKEVDIIVNSAATTRFDERITRCNLQHKSLLYESCTIMLGHFVTYTAGSRSDIFSQLDRACLLEQNALELVILFYLSDGILNPLGLTAESYFEICCCRDEKSQLLLGLKRANHQQTSLPSSVLSADNIREIAKEGCGLISLQENLLSDLLKKDKIDLSDIDRGVSMIKECSVHKKFLVDVDDLNQTKDT
ncbi:hypothetical protein CQW23_14286 [Capsicum baccatum]|uniref:Threonylcarbamoyl-AMP synthase n=1 Tax=Capsicum baccatum TaxID=33114 RepID=A0A2G2WIQ8_CAPBA|nr:hypothetical protein CQW23_14286 [Capsicum baccatum]